LSVPVSTVGFSRLIAFLYPLFGYIGVIISGAVFVHGIKRVITGWRRRGRKPF
jgi:uncharacterized membrane protein YkvI